MNARISRLLFIAAAAALFLIVLGAKWAAIDRFGSDLPMWDQWDAEGRAALLPWLEGKGFFSQLFHPHNEHRVVLTKLQNLALTLLNGQWDARLECVVNAVLASALALGFWLVGRRWMAESWRGAFFVVIVALFGLPLAWENVLGGFHAQQYWLLALSLIAIVVWPFARPWSAVWWASAVAAALALLAMASGFFAAAVVGALVLFRIWRRETTWREMWPTLAFAGILVALGLLTRVAVPGHEALKAQTGRDFFLHAWRSLAWPGPRGAEWVAVLLWLPSGLVAWGVARETNATRTREGFTIVAVAGWVLAQIFATAYARGAGANYPAPRYLDTLACGVVTNAVAVGWLLSRAALRGGWTSAAGVLGLVWLGALAFGLAETAERTFRHELPAKRESSREAEMHLREYLATNDPAQLASATLPYFREGLIDLLTHPPLPALMPVSVRPPLAMRPASAVRTTFLENRAQPDSPSSSRHGQTPATPTLDVKTTWGSFNADAGAAVGEWTSSPLTAPGGWLKFETAGHVGEPGVTLELRDAQTGVRLATIHPSRVPRDTWRAAYVRAPRVAFVIFARDSDPHRWLAFSGPVEMGSMSFVAWQAAKHGLLIARIAAVVAFVCGLVWWVPRLATMRQRWISTGSGLLPVYSNHGEETRATPRAALALAVALFLAVWGARLVVIDRFGSDLPFWDQWGKEGELMYAPWFEKGEFWPHVFVSHSEHRIAPTLTMNLGLVLLGGQWDARVQCIASAALIAAVFGGMFFALLRRFALPGALAGGVLLFAIGAPPLVWENITVGFQSQFYFLIGASGLAMAGLLGAPAFSLRWWGGLAAGAVALVCMGSGLVCAAPIAAVAAMRLLHGGRTWRSAAATLLAGVLLGLAGLWLRSTAPWHESLHATSARDFLLYFVRCLAWPLPQYPWFAALVWAPWFVLLAVRVRDLWRTAQPAADFVLAGGMWVFAQAAAVSYSRGAGAGFPANRYGDIFSLGLALSFAALLLLQWRKSFHTATVIAFVSIAIAVVIAPARSAWATALPERKSSFVSYEASVREFVRTDDYATFEKSPIPLPSAEWLARVLRRDSLRAILPASVRSPQLRTLPAPLPSLSRGALQLVACGPWILGFGTLGLLALAVALLRQRSRWSSRLPPTETTPSA